MGNDHVLLTVKYYLLVYVCDLNKGDKEGKKNISLLKPLHGYAHIQACNAHKRPGKLISLYGSTSRATQC